MDNVLNKVLKKITPSNREREELSGVLKRLVDAAESVIKPMGLQKTIAGSFIRDTWLTDKKEIDLFIMFPVSYPRGDLEKLGLETGKRIVKKLKGEYEIAYAEHPYVRGKVSGFSVDIVPCYKVKSASKIISAVDRTPFHNRYIAEHLKPEMAKEVRLIKQFCKAIDVYGSDIRTLGFSGYLCELLIIKHRTFKKLVLSARNWKFGKFMDLEGHCYIRKPKSFFRNHPLIVIDPTDPKRNVAAALSDENFVKFVKSCENFVKKPSERFFRRDMRTIKIHELRRRLKARGTRMFAIRFGRPKVVDDILWSQMRKTSSRLVNLLKDNDFEIFDTSVWSDEKDSYLLLEMKSWFLPKIRRLRGPPVHSKKHSKQFIDKYGGKAKVEGKNWVAEIERKYRKVEILLEDFLKRSDKLLRMDGVRSHIAKSIGKDFEILSGRGFERTIKNRDLAIFLRKYF
ncbi:MAG: CCA tRNA nucleotidyltransferase [Candidatus Aenigmarchaeota archaeon]|nr:CCA tRNA nucleotidyltransferase [Candidatus Aenigmarchaeota archaeon]NIP39940.1 CCA tRNA nucleotidyltransferase [Candidatus Aenigmarchaeota archaeon]NIQ17659.1 CCA tRNA nucleotidyltransferase [Candidatus Aenigmarchaeota archaeon]NIS72847.1 CCA tRNA nucleotidyltransferase [Candidatus Aenigmarchaeota archaeon]